MPGDETNPICCEIGATAWRLHAGGAVRSLSVEREALIAALRPLEGPVYCLLEGRGVAVRRVTIPAGPAASRPQLLRLQIERDFPLSPDELAWWSRKLPGSGQGVEYLVIAVKRDLIAPVQEIFAAAGVEARFTIGVIAAAGLAPQAPAFFFADDARGELVEFADGVVKSIRVFPADGIESVQQKHPDAATPGSTTDPAAAGLAALARRGQLDQLPILNVGTHGADTSAQRISLPWKWIALAAALAIGLFMLRYAEAWLHEPKLAKQLEEFNGELTELPAINREVSFLQHIQKNQPPYLAALAVLADSCSRGTKLESVSLDRRGEITFRGKMQSSQNASDLRRKLIESGLFTNVVLEEQNPVKGRREVTVRFSARWKTSRKAKSETLKRIDSTPPKTTKGPGRSGPSLRRPPMPFPR